MNKALALVYNTGWKMKNNHRYPRVKEYRLLQRRQSNSSSMHLTNFVFFSKQSDVNLTRIVVFSTFFFQNSGASSVQKRLLTMWKSCPRKVHFESASWGLTAGMKDLVGRKCVKYTYHPHPKLKLLKKNFVARKCGYFTPLSPPLLRTSHGELNCKRVCTQHTTPIGKLTCLIFFIPFPPPK